MWSSMRCRFISQSYYKRAAVYVLIKRVEVTGSRIPSMIVEVVLLKKYTVMEPLAAELAPCIVASHGITRAVSLVRSSLWLQFMSLLSCNEYRATPKQGQFISLHRAFSLRIIERILISSDESAAVAYIMRSQHGYRKIIRVSAVMLVVLSGNFREQ